MRSRFTRRLVFAVLWLAAFDPFVPSLLRRVERDRYEAGSVYRFENSDLFALGPLVEYLREHPRSDRRRIVFLGNSIMFGYGLAAADAIPARFQEERPGSRVFNAAFNGAGLGSSYLIAKAVVESVDTLVVLVGSGESADGLLPSLIPVGESDLRTFALSPPDPIERRLQSFAGFWKLYASRYRLQAALFSTSTRQYVYRHKGDVVRRLVASVSPPAPALSRPPRSGGDRVELRAPRSEGGLDAEGRRGLRKGHPLLCSFADLARSHRKRIVFVQADGVSVEMGDAEAAAFNAMFAPFAEVVCLRIPESLRFDVMHVTHEGAREVAAALSRHDRGQATGR